MKGFQGIARVKDDDLGDKDNSKYEENYEGNGKHGYN